MKTKSKVPVKKTRKELEDEIFRLQRELPDPMKSPLICLSDSTSEGLQKFLLSTGGVAAFFADEGDLLSIIAGR